MQLGCSKCNVKPYVRKVRIVSELRSKRATNFVAINSNGCYYFWSGFSSGQHSTRGLSYFEITSSTSFRRFSDVFICHDRFRPGFVYRCERGSFKTERCTCGGNNRRKSFASRISKSISPKHLSLIETNHVKGKGLDYNELFKSSIDTMLHTLDPHSNYFDAKEFEQFRTDQSSRYFGIGATIGDLSDADGKVVATYIKATFDGAPANRAGLRYGDKIIEVNGTSMLGKPFTEVRNFLRGPKGTPAKIVVERLATGKRETVEIVRDAVSQPSISEVYMIRPGVGYMAMSGGFNQTTHREFADGYEAAKG